MPPPLVCATVHATATRELRARRDEVVGAEVVKLAVRARRLGDCLALPRSDPSGRSKTIVVAMGAAGLADAGARVTVHARRVEQAAEPARQAGICAGAPVPAADSWDLLVNATPVGTTPHADTTPLAFGRISGRVVYDLVYNPPRTRLLPDAETAGCRTIGGLEMLIAQAAQQIALWTGLSADREVMGQAAAAGLERCAQDQVRALPATGGHAAVEA